MGTNMQIALNASSLLSPRTGIGQYTYQLAKGLQTIANLDLNFFYATNWSNTLREAPLANIVRYKSVFKKFIPKPYQVMRSIKQFTFSKGVRARAIDLYHEPNFLSFTFNGPTVLTVHDLSWIRFPETHPKDRIAAMDRYFEPSLRRANFILTDSEFVKSELIEVFGLPPTLIKAIPLGVEPLFHPRTSADTKAVLNQHQLQHGEYFLSVATLEPRKNLSLTINAFMKLSPKLRKRFPLVLIGMHGWHTSALDKQIAPLLKTGEIRQLGYVTRQDLATLIAGALTLVFPSLYEGFGLPPLEAMRSGVPVVASNTSSLPEVVGDTGFLIDPNQAESLTRVLEKLVDEPDLRQHLSQQALARSFNFSWEKCVSETVEVYHHVLETM